jgi:hypothetical protein
MRVPKVRWDTEYEEADCDELMAGSDDFAIWLDRKGWEIRMKDGCRSETATKLGTVDNLWHMQKPNTATPAWAFHDEDGAAASGGIQAVSICRRSYLRPLQQWGTARR